MTSTIEVAGAGAYLTDVDLITDLAHTFAADLDITLQSPAGTVVTLTTDNGAGNDNVFTGTTFDDQADPDGQVPYVTNPGIVTDHPYANNTAATPLVPEEALAAFIGENPNGTWTITISDDLAGDGGALQQLAARHHDRVVHGGAGARRLPRPRPRRRPRRRLPRRRRPTRLPRRPPRLRFGCASPGCRRSGPGRARSGRPPGAA